MNDYYQILKVSYEAKADEIKKAYRQAALFWHPDKNKMYNAKDKFIEITEAYNILIDPVKRKLYDNLLKTFQAIPSNINNSKETKDNFRVYEQWAKAERIKAEKLSLASIDGILTNSFHFLDEYGKKILWTTIIAILLLTLIFAHK